MAVSLFVPLRTRSLWVNIITACLPINLLLHSKPRSRLIYYEYVDGQNCCLNGVVYLNERKGEINDVLCERNRPSVQMPWWLSVLLQQKTCSPQPEKLIWIAVYLQCLNFMSPWDPEEYNQHQFNLFFQLILCFIQKCLTLLSEMCCECCFTLLGAILAYFGVSLYSERDMFWNSRALRGAEHSWCH